ncbi:hypothetical protein BGX26_002851 [Mortierella sp. AD094]|nr:hypothetical protein BGX26_002851 [Mortierella sp. AD094]
MSDILSQLIEFATQVDLQRLIVTQTHHDSAEPLQLFAGFTAFSILLDVIWCLLSPGIGFGEGLTIAVLLLKPMTIISAFQLLKFRGDPFSSLGGGMNWTGRSHGYEGGGLGGYQTLGDALDYERDAEEISIPRHHTGHGQMHGLNRNSQQSGSFLTTSSRSTSVKSSRTGSGHNVELGTNTGANSGGGHHGNDHNHGSPASAAIASVGGGTTGGTAKDDRRDRVGQNTSEDEDEDASSRDTSAHGGSDNTRAGYQAF